MSLIEIDQKLSQEVDELTFGEPVTHVYNPLSYAWAPHALYLNRFGKSPKRTVLIGMNPGPFGMAQTGVPFGDVKLVREWMGIDAPVKRPLLEHAKRPILGFQCSRCEVSGSRLWGWAKDRFKTADAFFERFFVINYCPLMFLEKSGKNRTPDKLPERERQPLLATCDAALKETLELLEPSLVVGIGSFAARRARLIAKQGIRVGTILHPSPASPRANRDWPAQAEAQLRALGVVL